MISGIPHAHPPRSAGRTLRLFLSRHLSPERIFILSFAGVILAGGIDLPAREAHRGASTDWNVAIAAFLNALDRWTGEYAARGPAAVRGAVRFLPRGRATIAGGAECALHA